MSSKKYKKIETFSRAFVFVINTLVFLVRIFRFSGLKYPGVFDKKQVVFSIFYVFFRYRARLLLYAKIMNILAKFCIKIEYYKIVTAFYSIKVILQEIIY